MPTETAQRHDEHPFGPRTANRQLDLRRARDFAFAIIGILALIAVLVLATVSPPATAAQAVRAHAHGGAAVRR
jgi:hypothetical protein